MISIQQWIEALPKYQQGKGCLCSVDHKVCCLGALMIEEGCTFQESNYHRQTNEGVPELAYRDEDDYSYFTMPPKAFLKEHDLLTPVSDLPIIVQRQVEDLLSDSTDGTLATALASINDKYQDDFASVISVLELLVIDEEEQGA